MVAGAAVAWSTSGLFTRQIHTDVSTLLVWRGFSGAACIALLMLWRDGSAGMGDFRRLNGPALAYALASSISMITFIAAFTHTTVADVLIIYTLAPFLVAAAAWFWFGERTSTATLVAAGVALLGIAITVGGGSASGGGNMVGDILAFVMTLGVVVMTVVARKYQTIPMMAAACVSALLTGVAGLPFAAPLSLSGAEMVNASLFGIVALGIALSLYSEGAPMAPASKVSLVSMIETPLAVALVWLAFGDTPPLTSILGGAIVMAAVAGNVVCEAKYKQ